MRDFSKYLPIRDLIFSYMDDIEQLYLVNKKYRLVIELHVYERLLIKILNHNSPYGFFFHDNYILNLELIIHTKIKQGSLLNNQKNINNNHNKGISYLFEYLKNDIVDLDEVYYNLTKIGDTISMKIINNYVKLEMHRVTNNRIIKINKTEKKKQKLSNLIFTSIKYHNNEIFHYYMDLFPELMYNLRDRSNNNLLLLCSKYNNYSLFKNLVEKYKFDLGYANRYNFTALHLACDLETKTDIIEFIFNNQNPYQLQMNHFNRCAKCPLSIAVVHDNLKGIKLLYKKNYSFIDFNKSPTSNPIIKAARRNNLRVVKYIHSKIIKGNSFSKYIHNLELAILRITIMFSKINIFKYIWEHNFNNINSNRLLYQNFQYGFTVLTLTIKYNRDLILDYLLAHDSPNIYMKDNFGFNAIDYAKFNNDLVTLNKFSYYNALVG